MKYKNIYLILGASSDLGVELLTVLNREKSGHLFICHYYSHFKLLEQIIPQNNNIFKCYQADFTVISEVHNFISKIKEECGIPTHIVHLLAGKFCYRKLKDFVWENFCQEIEIQVHGFLEILKAFLPVMAKSRKKGKIVILLSSCTISDTPKYMLDYMMAIYALMGAMKSLASDYSGKNVCINAVSPWMIETKFWDKVDHRLVEQNAQRSLEKRNADVSDIVPVIQFLLSEDSDFIHGVNLNVTNGNLL